MAALERSDRSPAYEGLAMPFKMKPFLKKGKSLFGFRISKTNFERFIIFCQLFYKQNIVLLLKKAWKLRKYDFTSAGPKDIQQRAAEFNKRSNYFFITFRARFGMFFVKIE